MNKHRQIRLNFIFIIIFILTLSLAISGCKNISKINKHSLSEKNQSNNEKNTSSDDVNSSPSKVLSLGKAQRSKIFEYVPSKTRRTSSITGDLGYQYRTEVNPNATKPTDDGITYEAGNGREYILVFIAVKNITDMPQEPLLTYDPQPTLESIKTKTSYEYDSLHSYRLKDSEQFSEAETLDPGKSQSGWVLFNVPASETKFLFKIEDLLWHI